MSRSSGRRGTARGPLGLVGLAGLLGLAGAMALLAARAARAHELGAFQVYGSFQRNGAFRLDIKVDEEHLNAAQLGGPARCTRYGRIEGLSGPPEQRFGRFLSDLADSLTVSFDGAPVALTLALDRDAAAAEVPTRATLRVEGWIPAGARAFTFKSTLPIKSYPLVLSSEGDETSSWRWVPGGQTSPSFRLAPRVVPPSRAAVARRWLELGFSGILPHGPVPLLLVVAMFLYARRIAAALLQLAVLTLGATLGLTLATRWAGAAALVRPAVFEPLLAVAVVCLAVLCLAATRPRRLPGWTAALIFAMGLLYGLGSARAFSPTQGLTPPLLPAAVAGFALGALGAELAATAAAFALVGLPFGDKPWYRGRVVVPASCLIAVVAAYRSLAALLV